MECGWRFLSVLFLGRLLTKLLNSLIHGDLREESNWKGHSYRRNVSDDCETVT